MALPITDLEEVETWLASLPPDTPVNISSSLFEAPLVNAIFNLLPGSDPIQLTPTTIDPQQALLTGTTTIFGQAEVTVSFQFSQPNATLLCDLTMALPVDLQWSLLPDLAVGFGSLVGQLTPDEDLNVLALEFDAEIETSTSEPINIPVKFSVPCHDGADWLLSTGTVDIGSLTRDGLEALAGNQDLTSILPLDLTDLTKFKLTGLEMAFNPSAGTCSLIRLMLAYESDWKFFNDQFTVNALNFEFEVLNPFVAGNRALYATLSAAMQVGEFPFEVGGQFPDMAVFARLAPESSLSVTEVFEFLDVPLPVGFPDVVISTLSFLFDTTNSRFNFNVVIDQPFAIVGDANLDKFLFELGADYDPVIKKITGRGQLNTVFSIGETELFLLGTYSEGSGLNLTGAATQIPIGTLIAELGGEVFDIQNIPAPIEDLVLETLTVNLNTDASSFNFSCEGTTTVADIQVDFVPVIHLSYNSGLFTGEFSGTLKLGSDLTFSVEFSKTPTDKSITASFMTTGAPLQFADIAGALNFTIPTIPPDLDLGLTSVEFTYDFGTGAFVLSADSNYGNAVFATMVLEGNRQFFFLLGVDQEFSLSDLPLIGEELAKMENVGVQNLVVIISSLANIDATTAAAINSFITPLGSNYPLIPTSGMTGTFVLTAGLDFGGNTLPLNLGLGGQPSGPPAIPTVDVETSSSAGGISWFTVQKSLGPLNLQRIGVMYQTDQQAIWFELDASISFGPMTLTLVGLGIGSSLKTFSPQFSLQGLGLSYSRPPVTISGALVNLAPAGTGLVEFEGGVTIGTETFTLEAFGFYGESTTASGSFTSMFIFGSLAYDFGGPPAFFVTGVALGFGYNSNLRIPTIDEVESFPFVEVLPASTLPNTSVFPNNQPLTVLNAIMNTTPPWVSPAPGSLWFAAGITFTSFQMVNSQALVIVETGAGLVISLVGTSRAQFPQPTGVVGEPVYAYIQLDLLARFAPAEGVFSLQAVLASSSFLLDKACVLTGGFAFFVWFGDNPHAGDFVLTLGGYNPAFVRPSYYPAVPPVGFHWSLDSSITITGGAYFAFTPSVLMVGGTLNATYQSGNLKAWFDAHADVIIQWKPFWFEASIGITIGASYTIDLLFTTATLSVELGCDLEIWGPPTGGTVTIDWYVIKFTIPFGTPKNTASVVHGWDDVLAMLPNTGTPDVPNVLTLTPSGGLTPATTKPDDAAPWIVRGSLFGFSTSSSIPATTAIVGDTYSFNGPTFRVAPLNWNDVSATHAIAITDSKEDDISSAFAAVQIQKNLPASLWATPPSGTPSGDGQLAMNQIVGVQVQVNPPQIGSTAGPVNVAANLQVATLNLPGAALPISNTATPQGDAALNSQTTISTIANPESGIASSAVIASRNEVLAALTQLGYAPQTRNNSMTRFAQQAGCAFAQEPLLVTQLS